MTDVGEVNQLSAMPGDEINFVSEGQISDGVVKTAGWQPSPKGGKIWTYETMDGIFVPYSAVRKISKSETPVKVIGPYLENDPEDSRTKYFGLTRGARDEKIAALQNILDELEVDSALKIAVEFIVDDSPGSLDLAWKILSRKLGK